MKFFSLSRHRTAASNPPQATDAPAHSEAQPASGLASSVDSLVVTSHTQALDLSSQAPQPPQPLQPLAPLRPLVARPRVVKTTVDMSAATLELDKTYWYARHKRHEARRYAGHYASVSERYPHEPMPIIKRLLAARDGHDETECRRAEHDLLEVVRSPYDKTLAWTALYCDREMDSSHRAFDLSLAKMFQYGEAEKLAPAERLLLLRHEDARGRTLMTRALLEGSADDLRAGLEFAKACQAGLGAAHDGFMDIALASRLFSKLTVLLQQGLRPQSNEAWARTADFAARIEDPYLLQAALDAGLDPNYVVELGSAPRTLVQLAASTRGSLAKLKCLVRGGARLVGTAPDSKLISAFRNMAREGPHGMSDFIKLGFSVNSVDPNTHRTPLMDLVEDKQAQCIIPLLQLGADPTMATPDGMTALDLARVLGLGQIAIRIARFADIAPYLTEFEAMHYGAIDCIADALCDLPSEDLAPMTEFAHKHFRGRMRAALRPGEPRSRINERWANLRIALIRFWPKWQRASEETRTRVLLRLCANDTFNQAQDCLRAFDLLQPEQWQTLLDHLPWDEKHSHGFNAEVLSASAAIYAKHGDDILTTFDLASYASTSAVRNCGVGLQGVIMQFAGPASRGELGLRVAEWARRAPAYNFGWELQARVREFFENDVFLVDPKIPKLPERPRFYKPEPAQRSMLDVFSETASKAQSKKQAPPEPEPSTAPKPAAKPKPDASKTWFSRAPEAPKAPAVALQQSLLDAVGKCPTVTVQALDKLETINVDEVNQVINVLQAPDVEDDIIDIPQSADMTLKLIEDILGRATIDSIYADPSKVELKPTRAFLLACHPDKVLSELQPTALAMTQLLNTIRALLSQDLRGPYLSAAFARSRQGGT